MLPCIRLNTKWRELASLLGEIFTATGRDGRTGEPAVRDGDGAIPRPAASPHQKRVIFTEHRDTLRYLRRGHRWLLDRERSTTSCQADVCEACGMLRLTSFRTGQPSHEPADEVSLDDAVPRRPQPPDGS